MNVGYMTYALIAYAPFLIGSVTVLVVAIIKARELRPLTDFR